MTRRDFQDQVLENNIVETFSGIQLKIEKIDETLYEVFMYHEDNNEWIHVTFIDTEKNSLHNGLLEIERMFEADYVKTFMTTYDDPFILYGLYGKKALSVYEYIKSMKDLQDFGIDHLNDSRILMNAFRTLVEHKLIKPEGQMPISSEYYYVNPGLEVFFHDRVTAMKKVISLADAVETLMNFSQLEKMMRDTTPFV